MKGPTPHRYCRRLTFAETDASGVAHFASLLRLVEEAEHDWLEKQGVAVHSPESAWPRVSVRADFRAPARFGDALEVELTPVLAGRTSIQWTFVIHRARDGELIAGGAVASCHVQPEPEGVWRPASLPEAVRFSG